MITVSMNGRQIAFEVPDVVIKFEEFDDKGNRTLVVNYNCERDLHAFLFKMENDWLINRCLPPGAVVQPVPS